MKTIALCFWVCFLLVGNTLFVSLQAKTKNYGPTHQKSENTTYIRIGISQPYVEECFDTSVFDETQQQKLTVFPNPGTGLFFVKMPSAEPSFVTITVYDIRGKAVFAIERSAEDTRSAMELNLEFLKSGMYFLHVRGNSRIFTSQIIIQ
jgi:hypothetical protein